MAGLVESIMCQVQNKCCNNDKLTIDALFFSEDDP